MQTKSSVGYTCDYTIRTVISDRTPTYRLQSSVVSRPKSDWPRDCRAEVKTSGCGLCAVPQLLSYGGVLNPGGEVQTVMDRGSVLSNISDHEATARSKEHVVSQCSHVLRRTKLKQKFHKTVLSHTMCRILCPIKCGL